MTTAFFAAMAVIGWGLFLCAAIGGNAIRDDQRRRIDTATALWKQAEVDKAALQADNTRLRSALPKDHFIDLKWERVLRGERAVGRVGDWDRDGA